MKTRITEKLNQLLANYHIHYQRSRSFHWNLKGTNFFSLHAKFEEFYTDALTRIDEIGERILTLEGQPLSSLQEYINTADLKECEGNLSDREMVSRLAEDFAKLIELEKEIFDIASTDKDERTGDMMNDFISFQEKTIWMLKAWLGKKVAEAVNSN